MLNRKFFIFSIVITLLILGVGTLVFSGGNKTLIGKPFSAELPTNQKYAYQSEVIQELLDPNRVNGEIALDTSKILFFHDYFGSKYNWLELINLPSFEKGKNPDWNDLSKFIFDKSTKRAEDYSITKEEFTNLVDKYFSGIPYTHSSSKWLTFKDNKYYPIGWDNHGFFLNRITRLERTSIGDGKYSFKAQLTGFRFYEEDLMQGSDSYSPNMKGILKEAQQPKYAGLSIDAIFEQVILNKWEGILNPTFEHTIEFTINDPEGDVWFKYLSANRKEINL